MVSLVVDEDGKAHDSSVKSCFIITDKQNVNK